MVQCVPFGSVQSIACASARQIFRPDKLRKCLGDFAKAADFRTGAINVRRTSRKPQTPCRKHGPAKMGTRRIRRGEGEHVISAFRNAIEGWVHDRPSTRRVETRRCAILRLSHEIRRSFEDFSNAFRMLFERLFTGKSWLSGGQNQTETYETGCKN
jgi:hypothetical protein